MILEVPSPIDVRLARKETGLTQGDLADKAGISQPMLSRIEGGDVDPTLSTLRDLAEAIEESADN